MKFTVFGHENMLGTHKMTLEFTKESALTKRGDCIIGVNADFGNIDVNGKIIITIETDGVKDIMHAEFNPSFDSHEMVIRKSSFTDKRTFAINADKAAIDIKREIINKLKSPNAMAIIEIKNA